MTYPPPALYENEAFFLNYLVSGMKSAGFHVKSARFHEIRWISVKWLKSGKFHMKSSGFHGKQENEV